MSNFLFDTFVRMSLNKFVVSILFCGNAALIAAVPIGYVIHAWLLWVQMSTLRCMAGLLEAMLRGHLPGSAMKPTWTEKVHAYPHLLLLKDFGWKQLLMIGCTISIWDAAEIFSPVV